VEKRVSRNYDDRPRRRRSASDPSAEVANLILRRILIFGGIFLGGVILLFCIVAVVALFMTGGFIALVNSARPQPMNAATSKAATPPKK
jgi:hypothetical protein